MLAISVLSEVLLGRSLRDREPTIVHHFAFHDDPGRFAYPDLAAGLLMSVSLLNSLARRYSQLPAPPVDFSIDPMHELALFAWREGEGPSLSDSGALCVAPAAGCATEQRPPPACSGELDASSVHYAVKTCAKFHKSRLPVVRETWARDAVHVRYYSDEADELYGTISVGVANTERGHCAKTLRILQRSAAVAGLRWLVVADDDTMLSVPRLHQLLACYSPSEPLLLGERYGFRTSGGGGAGGYSYITGGGGMVLSVEAVRRLSASCRCPTADTPDDMQLGLCAAAASITLVHSPRFHQARPPDYPAEVLTHSRPVSFHKHWMIDPRAVYRTWLQEPRPAAERHSEL
ncbi:beta-1,3-glucosyltransferase-like [Pollicipes pollicipes]|uniref:beta-1,3-glucosyltransferase-like n=1 Tax=Pollicipes pollicipes TaxID=41117 RepID=UPI00188530A4|nr:beta-1,3-glucosyltransferase-like [Pollicipes pollicipes]